MCLLCSESCMAKSRRHSALAKDSFRFMLICCCHATDCEREAPVAQTYPHPKS